MDSKFPTRATVAIGTIKIECEGEELFVESMIEKLLDRMIMQKGQDIHALAEQGAKGDGRDTLSLSITTIASKMDVKKGSDLLLAAGAYFDLVEGRTTFSRSELLDKMKSARGYYKSTFRSNLSNYILTLVKADSLRETSPDTYSLSASARRALEEKLRD